MQKQIKNVLLDLGGVVFQSTGRSNQKINWSIITELNAIYGHDLNIGKDRLPEFLIEYNERTNQSLIAIDFLKEVFDTLDINTELIEFIRRKSEIVIVSDIYRENIEYISKRYKFNSWSVNQIYSFDYKMVKANPLFFEKLLLENQHLSSRELLFIDDSVLKINSATAHGIRAILYEDNSQIKKELKKFGWSD